MTQHETPNCDTGSTSTEFSVTMELPYRNDRDAHKSLLITFTSKFEFEIDLQHPFIRDEINRIVGEDNFPLAFGRLLTLGNLAADPQIFDKLDSNSIDYGLLGKSDSITVNDAKGQPIRHLRKYESEVIWERMKAASMRARMLAILLDAVFEQIGSKYQAHVNTIASVFRSRFISERDANIFARAYRYYCKGLYDDAARTTLPSIETVIRSIAHAIYGSAYIDPKDKRDGRESSLGRLISMLDQKLPEMFLRELKTILTDPLGLNLRNIHLHGLAKLEPKHDAAIILYTAAQLTLIRVDTTERIPN